MLSRKSSATDGIPTRGTKMKDSIYDVEIKTRFLTHHTKK
jgi:hypothetical protein